MIPHLSFQDIHNLEILEAIYTTPEYDYYWSEDFSPEFYIDLAKRGFIAIDIIDEGEEYLLPEMQPAYALLEHEELHISHHVKKLLNQQRYVLRINTHLKEIIQGIQTAYEDCWIHPKYEALLHQLSNIEDDTFQLMATALIDTHTQTMVAGEIGYIIHHHHYVGLTKFSLKDKSKPNLGTLQRVLLTNYLTQEKDIHLSNLGQPQMEYKLALGAKVYPRTAFLKRCGFIK